MGFKGTHTKIDKIVDFCENIRQDFEIYRNIDHQKAKKLKKETKEKRIRHTNKQASKQINKQTNKETTKTNKQCRLIFFWSDAMVGAIACGQTKQIKRQQASNHANQHKLMNFETGPAPQNPKATPRLAEVLAWLGRPQRRGLCFLIEIVRQQNDRRFGNFANIWR